MIPKFTTLGSGPTVLMLHGMSDSPYSLRHLAEVYRARGFVVLIPRMPGHGTAPSGDAWKVSR